MEALQPLTDVLGALEPPGVKTVLQAAALGPGVMPPFGLLLTVLAARRWRTR